jgi:hypothetical protein
MRAKLEWVRVPPYLARLRERSRRAKPERVRVFTQIPHPPSLCSGLPKQAGEGFLDRC